VTAPATVAPETAQAPAPAAMVLGYVTGSPAPAPPSAEWHRALAPEVLLRVVDPDPDLFEVPDGSVPYALFAAGSGAARAAQLAQTLLARGHGPAHLMMCQGLTPISLPEPLTCRLTVFAGPGEAGAAAHWRTCGAGEFTLRVLPDPVAVPPSGPVSAELALAVKEELGVWPF
jgi:hypothetical protein